MFEVIWSKLSLKSELTLMLDAASMLNQVAQDIASQYLSISVACSNAWPPSLWGIFSLIPNQNFLFLQLLSIDSYLVAYKCEMLSIIILMMNLV